MASEYVEQEALRAYVWQHCAEAMTEEERRAGQAIALRGKFAQTRDNSYLAEKFPWAFSREMDRLLEAGPEAYLDSVTARVLSTGLSVNRCPACQKVVRTPVARLCLWCGHDWRHQEDRPGILDGSLETG